MTIKRIEARQLAVGMYVHVCWDGGHPFLTSRFQLHDVAMIEEIVAGGVSEIWIDTSRGRDVADGQLERRSP